ncbi:type III polyketide Synthase [Stachybotrys elegans]|uniref:Type III polyketide Synthase n=1 Tax=Stachybotrys elegans TaxID=80388 RepID=A0A8K0WPS2_9HYPO|nr:type III polyketide Synthase [Stachybotrys elegans]
MPINTNDLIQDVPIPVTPVTPVAPFNDIGLSITGLGTQYPKHRIGPEGLEALADRFCQDTPNMRKVLAINRKTGIASRPTVINMDHPLMTQMEPPTIEDQHDLFMAEGLPLAISAARKAMADARLEPSDITHLVATTCTDSCNPGYDHYVAKELGLPYTTERVLLHGVGCSGGLAVLRTAANLALGHTARGQPARVLCVALEVVSLLGRTELAQIDKTQQVRVGASLFSDGSSAVVLSNDIGKQSRPIYQLLGWEHALIPGVDDTLRFDVEPSGWRVTLSPLVPKITAAAIAPTFNKLMAKLPHLPPVCREGSDFDWAMHPGGQAILKGTEQMMGVTEEHLRASYATYMTYGNSSSASVFSVMDRLRTKEMDAVVPGGRVRDHVVACAFGPAVTIEMFVMKRVVGLAN